MRLKATLIASLRTRKRVVRQGSDGADSESPS